MKQNVMLTIASLLSILLLTLHITDDIVRGISKAEPRSEEHTSELQSQSNLVCRLLLEKKNIDDALHAVGLRGFLDVARAMAVAPYLVVPAMLPASLVALRRPGLMACVVHQLDDHRDPR